MGFLRAFHHVGLPDAGAVGTKNAWLGEIVSSLGPHGVKVPDGFAVTGDGYRSWLEQNELVRPVGEILANADRANVDDLVRRSERIRALVMTAPLPAELAEEIRHGYESLSLAYGEDATDVAVRSSAAGSPRASAALAGELETVLDVRGADAVLTATVRAFASLFGPRAIARRIDAGLSSDDVALSVGVQKMVRAARASSGLVLTMDAETGHRGVVLVTSAFGLGGAIVEGKRAPDRFLVHKETLLAGHRPLFSRRLGSGDVRSACDLGRERTARAAAEESPWSLRDDEVLALARTAVRIEEHFARVRGGAVPIEIEWAKDAETGELFVVQARPAVEAGARIAAIAGQREASALPAGDARALEDARAAPRPKTKIFLNFGNPNHALQLALLPTDGVGLARMEFIFACWVGVHPLAITRYETLPAELRRDVDRVIGDRPDKTAYFVERLAEGIGTIAAAFHPRPVVLRFSDFQTNEFAKLAGGAPFEPAEDNPMLGWRGASRYYHPSYAEGFLLEVAAVRRVRETFGLTNLELLIPFCRTPEEGARVLDVMRAGGLVRGSGPNRLEVHVMAEIPSNIILAEAFAQLFDGFIVGTNDLTQLTLGIDRAAVTVAPLFDERNDAVKWSCAHLIDVAHACGRRVGIAGLAPNEPADFIAFLVEHGIDSISVTPEALARTWNRVLEAEARIAVPPAPRSEQRPIASRAP